MSLRLVCEPAFDYACARSETTVTKHGAVFGSRGGPTLALSTELPLVATERGVEARFTLREGEKTTLVLRGLDREEGCRPPATTEQASKAFEDTIEFWRRWLSKSTYRGRWREVVHRSALLLKLLTFEPTGAIVAAPTCSLPEVLGGSRNWDYRYTWSDRRLLDRARLLFERMLYAEQTSVTGEALGNYPQALTHLALISAAYNLDRALDAR